MQREILFRGKRCKDNQWIYGLPWKKKFKDGNRMFISHFPFEDDGEECDTVFKETIGQYTGLTDKEGNKIFEGDIVKYTRKNMYCPSAEFHNKDLTTICEIYWCDKEYMFRQRGNFKNGGGWSGSITFNDDRADNNEIELIGTIHDNPELLKEGN